MERAKNKGATSPAASAQSAQLQLLGTYVKIWAINSLLRVLTGPGRELVYKYPVACCLVVSFSFPDSPLALLVGFGARVYSVLSSYPFVHDSQNWALQTDLAVLIAFVSVLIRRHEHGRGLTDRFGDTEAASWLRAASSTVRFQYLFFYIAAALYKANEGFMHPRFSCAPVYLVQMVEAYVPADVIAGNLWAINMITAYAPLLVLVVEALVPILMWIDIRAGIAFAGAFHFMIAITPPPNDIANFGTQTLPRMLLLVPDPSATVAAATAIFKPGLRGFVIVAFTALTVAVQPMTWLGHFDFAVPLCAYLSIMLTLASFSSYRESRAPAADGKDVEPIGTYLSWILRAYAVYYSLLAIPLGTQDMGTANMFSSMRMHGGSNHWFMPANLLQIAFGNASEYPPDSTLVGEIFGGGIVRIESTNCSHLIGPSGVDFPGELVEHTEAAKELLVASGHSGRQWSPMTFYNKVGNHPTGSRPASDRGPVGPKVGSHLSPVNRMGQFYAGRPFSRYSIPAKELRRLLAQARSRHPTESFDIVGSFLPGMVGDEEWRAHASAFNFILKRRVIVGASDVLTCEDASAATGESGEDNPPPSSSCPPWVESTLFASESSHPLAWLGRRLILSQPYPIVPGDEGSHRRVHCFGP